MRWSHLPTLAALILAPLPAWTQSIHQLDPSPAPAPGAVTAIVGATLIDGRGGPPVRDAVVVVRGERIVAAGPRAAVPVPSGAERIDARGLAVLPGLIDAHFHLSGPAGLPGLFLRNGVTSLRDPGAWIEDYAEVRASPLPVPRLFLTGPHLDSPTPAHPKNALLLRDEEETRRAVERLAEAGATAIKVYFRLPLGMIRAASEAGDSLGLPVTGHLEIVDARDAIRAGIDGIEHVTSFGTALAAPKEAEAFRQAVIAENGARRDGRFRLWSGIDVESPAAREAIGLMVREGVFLAPTLAIFERRQGERGATEEEVRGFRAMMGFVGRAHRAGGAVVVGSHATAPYAERGWAYHREMELFVEAGMTPMEAIVAATSKSARFLRIDDRLGTVEPGKIADLLLVEGDPAREISAIRQVRRVMLNGRWVRTLTELE